MKRTPAKSAKSLPAKKTSGKVAKTKLAAKPKLVTRSKPATTKKHEPAAKSKSAKSGEKPVASSTRRVSGFPSSPPPKKGAAAAPQPSKARVPPPVGVIKLPAWSKPILESVVATINTPELTSKGPHAFARIFQKTIAGAVEERFGERAPSGPFGALLARLADDAGEKSPLHRLAAALEPGYEDAPDWRLRPEADDTWIFRTAFKALEIEFAARAKTKVPTLLKPLFERAIRDVVISVHGSNAPVRRVTERLAKNLETVLSQAKLANVADKLGGLIADPMFLEAAIVPRLTKLRIASATSRAWRDYGFPELAKRRDDDVVEIDKPRWIARDGEVPWILDHFVSALAIQWEKPRTPEEARRCEALLHEAGLVRGYKLGERFSTGESLSHPKFGIGVVLVSTPNIIEVAFADGVKKLGVSLPR